MDALASFVCRTGIGEKGGGFGSALDQSFGSINILFVCVCLLLAISFPLSSSVSVCAMMPGLLGQQQAERVHMVDGSGHT